MAKRNKKLGIVFASPKAKYKRFHKFICKVAPRCDFSESSVGNFALKALEFGRLSSAELDASKKFIKKMVKKKGTLYVRAYTYLPLTKKPGETRMGKGKSSRVSEWVCPVYAGKILFELSGTTRGLALQVFGKVREKISILTRTVQLIK